MKGAISARASNTMTVPNLTPYLMLEVDQEAIAAVPEMRQLLYCSRVARSNKHTALGIPRESSCLECSTVRLSA